MLSIRNVKQESQRNTIRTAEDIHVSINNRAVSRRLKPSVKSRYRRPLPTGDLRDDVTQLNAQCLIKACSELGVRWLGAVLC